MHIYLRHSWAIVMLELFLMKYVCFYYKTSNSVIFCVMSAFVTCQYNFVFVFLRLIFIHLVWWIWAQSSSWSFFCTCMKITKCSWLIYSHTKKKIDAIKWMCKQTYGRSNMLNGISSNSTKSITIILLCVWACIRICLCVCAEVSINRIYGFMFCNCGESFCINCWHGTQK